MNKKFKIGALSLALLISLFLLNTTTKAANGDVSLQITASTGSCLYGTSVYVGSTGFSSTASSTLSSGFNNVSGTARRSCNDSEGDSAWTLTITASGDLLNGSIGVISGSNIKAKIGSLPTVYSGNCTTGTSALNTSTYTAINTTKTIFSKTSTLGQTCTIGVNALSIEVTVPPYQAIGMYTGMLVVTLPGFDNVAN